MKNIFLVLFFGLVISCRNSEPFDEKKFQAEIKNANLKIADTLYDKAAVFQTQGKYDSAAYCYKIIIRLHSDYPKIDEVRQLYQNMLDKSGRENSTSSEKP